MTSLHFDSMSCYDDIVNLPYGIITLRCHYLTSQHHNVEMSLTYILMKLGYYVITV